MKSLLLLVLMPWRKSLVNVFKGGEGFMLRVLVPVGKKGFLVRPWRKEERGGKYCFDSMSAFAMLVDFRI
ncbi:MAG: hypothetical protein RBR38_09640 [Desulfomicrobium apsheronum]|nr:hypothetical protein [Desulfomicrobium apsheronum]